MDLESILSNDNYNDIKLIRSRYIEILSNIKHMISTNIPLSFEDIIIYKIGIFFYICDTPLPESGVCRSLGGVRAH